MSDPLTVTDPTPTPTPAPSVMIYALNLADNGSEATPTVYSFQVNDSNTNGMQDLAADSMNVILAPLFNPASNHINYGLEPNPTITNASNDTFTITFICNPSNAGYEISGGFAVTALQEDLEFYFNQYLTTH